MYSLSFVGEAAAGQRAPHTEHALYPRCVYRAVFV
jgi:hypothetical protein